VPFVAENSGVELPDEALRWLAELDAAPPVAARRRRVARRRYRVVAELRLYADPRPRILYSHDVSQVALGFLSPAALPLGYGGILRLADPAGEPVQIDCTILRCVLWRGGWFEGAIQFNRRQDAFNPE